MSKQRLSVGLQGFGGSQCRYRFDTNKLIPVPSTDASERRGFVSPVTIGSNVWLLLHLFTSLRTPDSKWNPASPFLPSRFVPKCPSLLNHRPPCILFPISPPHRLYSSTTPVHRFPKLLTLPLKVSRCPHECYALVHNPFTEVEVSVDEGANIRGLDFVSSDS